MKEPDADAASQDRCPVCGQAGPTTILTLHDVPVACNVLAHSRADALAAATGDVRLAFCNACSMIWNVAFRDALIGYDAAYENSLHFSPVFEHYATELARSLVDRYHLQGRRVVEIASGKGDFLALLCDAGVGSAAGFDPSYDGESDGRIDHERVVVERRPYLPADAADADLVCARHFLEHVPDPRALLHTIAEQLDPGRSIVYLEVPDAGYMLRDTAVFDVLYEHCTYFTGRALTEALARTGLVAARIGTSFGAQYLWVEARPAAGHPGLTTERADERALEPLAELRQRAAGFARDAEAVFGRGADLIDQFAANGREVVVWGAGTKGVMFLNTVPGAERITRVVDANPRKRGRFVPVTGQEVVAPDDLRAAPPGAVVVTNPLYRDEIAASLAALGIDAPVARRSEVTAPNGPTPIVSVGLPVYNGERYLEQAVASILTQDVDLELLLLADNASTDRTSELCRDLAGADPRVRYLASDVNRGATWNYNRLVPLARGRYFKWAAHDDVCGDGFLRRCADALDADPTASVAYPKTLLIGADDAVIDPEFVDGLAIGDPDRVVRFRRYVSHVGERHAVFGVVRRELLAHTSLIANCWGGDIVLLAQLVLLGGFAEIDDRLFLRRYHPHSSMVANESAVEVAQWFDPSKRGRTALPRTRLLGELARVIARADLDAAERARCYAALTTAWIPRFWRVMGGELRRSARSVVAGAR